MSSSATAGCNWKFYAAICKLSSPFKLRFRLRHHHFGAVVTVNMHFTTPPGKFIILCCKLWVHAFDFFAYKLAKLLQAGHCQQAVACNSSRGQQYTPLILLILAISAFLSLTVQLSLQCRKVTLSSCHFGLVSSGEFSTFGVSALQCRYTYAIIRVCMHVWVSPCVQKLKILFWKLKIIHCVNIISTAVFFSWIILRIFRVAKPCYPSTKFSIYRM